jgi:hypothetical protein
MLLQNIFYVLCPSFLPARLLHGRNSVHNRLRYYLLLHGVLLLIILHLLNLLDSLMMATEAGDQLQIHWHHRIVLVGQSVEPSKQGLANFPITVVTRMVLMPVIIFVDYIIIIEGEGVTIIPRPEVVDAILETVIVKVV